MPHNLPLTIGACLPVPRLAEFRDWLCDKDRDVEIQTFHAPHVLDSDWRPLAEQAVRDLDGHKGRRGIHGPFWGITIASNDPMIQDVVRHRMMQGLDVCEAVGATHMVIHSPYTTWDYNHDVNPDSSRACIQTSHAHATLGPVVKRAEDQGVVLVIENISDMNPARRVHLADSFESEAVRVSLDTGHAHLAYGSRSAPPVDHYVMAAGERLAHVHLQDADGYGDRHWAIGRGNISWHGVFDAIAALETRPRLVLELANHDHIPESVAWLAARGLAE
ncbi:MAG: sugar phosphate isomerase/epimerase family protein [Paracoccaceae bacterium]